MCSKGNTAAFANPCFFWDTLYVSEPLERLSPSPTPELYLKVKFHSSEKQDTDMKKS